MSNQEKEQETHRDHLGRAVREEWVEWAKEQPLVKPNWLQSYDELTEPEREVDRRIGERLFKMGVTSAAYS